MIREKKIKALYTLFKLADKAKDLYEYRLANLTFGLAVVFLENFEIKYENAGDPLSAYYDVVSICLADRVLSIPVPLLNKDTLAECLKICVTKGKLIERLEHNRQFKNPSEKSYQIIVSRFFKILKTYFDINNIESALWALDLSEQKEFEEWCFGFLTEATEPNEEILVN